MDGLTRAARSLSDVGYDNTKDPVDTLYVDDGFTIGQDAPK